MLKAKIEVSSSCLFFSLFRVSATEAVGASDSSRKGTPALAFCLRTKDQGKVAEAV